MFRSIINRVRKGGRRPDGFSIICAFNDRKKLDNYLIPSLRRQVTPFELLTIDNQDGGISCGPRVLNEAARNAKYDHLMFVHQDVTLSSGFWLSYAQRTIERLRHFGAAGVAGKSKSGLAASVSHGNPPQFVGPKRLRAPVPVQTLDGCLMIVSREAFMQTEFDEQTCSGWYLYVAEYCLTLARLGLKVFVLPHEIYHESLGPSDHGVFEKTRRSIIEKHRDHIEVIYTTVGEWKT